jgi:serine protease Do
VRDKRMYVVILSVIVIGFWVLASYTYALTPKEIYQKVSPGVVFIYASEGSGSGSGGTGSIIREDGLVITNAHIFARKNSSEPISDIWVFLKPEKVTGDTKRDLTRRYKATIVAYDAKLDLALLKIVNTDVPLSQVSFGDSQKIVVGDQAYAIGHPEQGGLWSLTTGVISAHKSNYAGVPGKDLFQTEASINRGNSGGPLLDEQGLMIGINSMIARKAEDGLTITDVNFSIKSNVALNWLNRTGYRFAAVETTSSKEVKGPIKEEATRIKDKEPVIADREQQPTKETTRPVKGEQTPAPKSEKGRKGGKILTEKKPYNMDELIAGMQEMEDLMEEMRGTIEEFRRRR